MRDGASQLFERIFFDVRPEQFDDLVKRIDVMLPVVGKERDL